MKRTITTVPACDLDSGVGDGMIVGASSVCLVVRGGLVVGMALIVVVFPVVPMVLGDGVVTVADGVPFVIVLVVVIVKVAFVMS